MKESTGAAVALLWMALAPVHAQAPKEQVASSAARCEKEVRDYIETLRFIRQSAGTQIGDRVAAGYIDEGTLRKVQGEQGSCAAAQLIRDKTSRRS